mmetsp:Transcript_48386/g.104210  ORF Transcript_48386/g.104210 Transcript_48386/m.104210 type:complete len:125 (-) Transcript_48386:53-427(-)
MIVTATMTATSHVVDVATLGHVNVTAIIPTKNTAGAPLTMRFAEESACRLHLRQPQLVRMQMRRGRGHEVTASRVVQIPELITRSNSVQEGGRPLESARGWIQSQHGETSKKGRKWDLGRCPSS